MARTVPSNAKPAMLKWARKTAHLSVEQVAKAEKVTEEVLAGWENGKGTPTLAKLRSLATRYKRPLMVFYLQERPAGFNIVKDFRTLPATVDREFSPELVQAIRRAQERQAWASQFFQDEGFPRSRFVGSEKVTSESTSIANKIRRALKVTLTQQCESEGAWSAYSLWRRACESNGVFVFQGERVALEERRGCALPDAFAPAILVNAKDSPGARSFTLIHELTHVMLGETVLSGAGKDLVSWSPKHATERFCNQVAADVLVPRDDFVDQVPRNWRSRDDEVIQTLANRYRVSRPVIVIRLGETGLADSAYVARKLGALPIPKKRKQGGAPPQHRLILGRVGRSFAETTFSAYRSGDIHGGELASLLGTKLKHLNAIESELYPNRVQAGSRARERSLLPGHELPDQRLGQTLSQDGHSHSLGNRRGKFG